jgi:hypothetical protein
MMATRGRALESTRWKTRRIRSPKNGGWFAFRQSLSHIKACRQAIVGGNC